jgi:recombinational DNA repair protein (RecF pathway)
MPEHHGWTGVCLHYCDRCGFEYRVSELSRQSGLIVCQKCRDNPIATISMDRRQAIIAQVLAEPGEEPALAEILKNTDSDVDDEGG